MLIKTKNEKEQKIKNKKNLIMHPSWKKKWRTPMIFHSQMFETGKKMHCSIGKK